MANKAIITVVGKDTVGIIAKVCTYLAENNINILDISRTLLVLSCEIDVNEEQLLNILVISVTKLEFNCGMLVKFEQL